MSLLCFIPGCLTERPMAVPWHYHLFNLLPPTPPSSFSSLLLNLWPIYTLENQKSLLKLRRALQQETTVSMNPIIRGRSDLQPHNLSFDSYKWGKLRLLYWKFLRCNKTTTVSSFGLQTAPVIQLWRGQFAAVADLGFFWCSMCLGPQTGGSFLFH